MATLNIEVPDGMGDALGALEFTTVDEQAAAELLRGALHALARTVADLADDLQDIAGNPAAEAAALRDWLRDLKAADVRRRVKQLARGLEAVA